MEVEVWNLSSKRIQILRKLPTVPFQMFHSQGSLSKFQIFKSHLVKRTAVPSADGHKDSSLGLTYFANEFFYEVGNGPHRYDGSREPKE